MEMFFEKQKARIGVGLSMRMWSGGVMVGNGEEDAVQYCLICASVEVPMRRARVIHFQVYILSVKQASIRLLYDRFSLIRVVDKVLRMTQIV